MGFYISMLTVYGGSIINDEVMLYVTKAVLLVSIIW